ncbi:C40 family peptidase [Paenibacillus filicis]|uniref:C40 family peptidase n=1 Tax=Paenibacillus gyeongsangnamensis TaxID=3388067 RepID=A0ABT4QG58_9BACL|nr:C40 family peptidase [Paenibacillus filicis]MCZ8515868.1 C40 family peptidase [Paenibacillus filicis]
MQWHRWLAVLALFGLIAGMALFFLTAAWQAQTPDSATSSDGALGSSVETQAVLASLPTLPSKEARSRLVCEAKRREASESSFRHIAVAVATLWSAPDRARAADRPSLGNPVDIRAWLTPLGIPEKLWLVGKLETEALLGTKVRVLEERGAWVKVAVPEQGKPGSPEGYPGWLPATQLVEVGLDYEACPYAVVRKPTAKVFAASDAEKNGTESRFELSFNTRLPIVREEESRWGVALPQGIRWIDKSDVKMAGFEASETNEPVTGEGLVETAMQFLELPYLWAGTSGFGFDCSGFTYSLYRHYGIAIPRDAKDQAAAGTPVGLKELKPGDLLFYAYNKGKGKVHHVSMYIGGGQMVHSPKTESAVEILPVQTPEYAAEFAGARRYLK